MISIYKYNIDDFKHVTRIREFIKGVDGLSEKIESENLSNKNIFMSLENSRKLYEYMVNNCNDEKYNKALWSLLCDFDWITYSPSTSKKEVPDDEIWLVW